MELSSISEQVENTTKWLVEIPSVNGTNGEIKIAEEIAERVRAYPYFKEHPDQVWFYPIPWDKLGRKSVFALIRGKGPSNRTVIFHSHMDTVDVKDFGQLEKNAYQPNELERFFKNWTENKEICQQALSGDWMFGRGCLDMKSGIAVHLANFLYFSENTDKFDGNILLMINPVEETSHEGIIAATEELLRLRKEEKLDFVAAINNDYTSSFYSGDQKKYIYTGAVGKVLPSFYVYGRETHVGQTLNGIDPTYVTSELNRLINNNVELSESVKNEMVLPPCVLLQREIKERYNVQTPITSYIYFNYMIYERSPKEIVEQLKKIAKKAARNTQKHYEAQYQHFLENNGLPGQMLSWKLKVYTFAAFCRHLSDQGIDVKKVSDQVYFENQERDIREIAFKIVDKLRTLDKQMQPCIILFFAPPYVPYTYIQGKNKRELELLDIVERETQACSQSSGEVFAIKRFFPYLSDSSYLSLIDVSSEMNALTDNFPEWDKMGQVPIANLRRLDIPSINLGVYGKDAHKWTERVYKPYSFETLPLLTRKITQSLLKAEE
ncbi:M20/M25/M40 family metallo-hydrolase [Sporolactobacillus sp. THM7-7]|nr:M20/M25/M40 family metallo-hydrolase [Sporolactobacillus sp. THM7-7]